MEHEDAQSMLNTKIASRVAALTAGARIRLWETLGTVLSQYTSKGKRQIRVQWDDGKPPQSYVPQEMLRAEVVGFDQDVADRDAFKNRVFSVLWKVMEEEGRVHHPDFEISSYRKSLLGAVEKAHGMHASDEQIAEAVRTYLDAWLSRGQKRLQRRRR